MDGNTEMPHGNVTCDDDVIDSWVSVCPSGLWKVQQKRTRGIRRMVSTSNDSLFFLGLNDHFIYVKILQANTMLFFSSISRYF